MKIYETAYLLVPLLEAANKLEYWLDGAKVKMSITQSGGIPEEVRKLPILAAAINEIARLENRNPVHVMVNRLPPGIIVPAHVDPVIGIHLDRWHLPIQTNKECFWWDAITGYMNMNAGIWYGPMRFDIPHRVGNLGAVERIHLIVDLANEDTNLEQVKLTQVKYGTL